MDPTTLVTFLVPTLARFLPYLAKAGDSAAEEAGEQLGAKAWSWAKSVWRTLRPRIEEHPGAKAAVEDVVQAPDDPDAIAALRLQLKKLLAAEPDLVARLAPLVDAAAPSSAIASGTGSVAIGRDAFGSTIIAGGNSGA